MRNKITIIILCISILILNVFLFAGIKIGNFEILSISKLISKNKELNEKITQASELTSTSYPENKENLEKTYEKYTIQKEKYAELSGFTTEDEKNQASETKKYNIEYLWKVLGNYATKYNLTIGMDIKKSGTQELYDLSFTVSGSYVGISEFILAIENDSDLSFRIYNFKISGNENNLTSSFSIKDVNIDSSTISSITPSKSSTTNNTNTNNTNTTGVNNTKNENNNTIQQ